MELVENVCAQVMTKVCKFTFLSEVLVNKMTFRKLSKEEKCLPVIMQVLKETCFVYLLESPQCANSKKKKKKKKIQKYGL